MSSNRQYTDEFRAEAVKQVIERGFSVVDVSTRIGIPKRKLPRQAGTSKVELSACWLRYSTGVIPPSESWGRSSL